MKPGPIQPGQGPLDLIEEAVHLLRLAPAATLLPYYLGSLPFVLGLLFFWADLSRGSFAADRLALEALGMALLFAWMKTWQAVFARQLLARRCGEPEVLPSWLSLARIATAQTVLQPWGLVLLPLALVSVFPFGWVYAFYQNVTVLDATPEASPRDLARQARRQACLWPAQNWCGLLALMVFGLFVFLNLASAFLLIPLLLKTLLGIETVFSRTWMALLNTTSLAAILSLTYLCMDPLAKTFYVLRCFYGQSLRNGRDLRAGLRALTAGRLATGAAVLLTLGLCLPGLCHADDRTPKPETRSPESGTRNSKLETLNSISPPELDLAIRKVIAQREFNWRLPRENPPPREGQKGALASLVDNLIESLRDAAQTVLGWIGKALEWLLGHRSRARPLAPGSLAWLTGLRIVLVALIILLVAVLAVVALRLWRRRRRTEPAEARPAQAAPDVSDENVGADQLPEDGWSRLARDLIDQGELRLALRALYLASLAHLAGRNLIGLARFKSNRDYQRELDRRGHALPELAGLFSENVGTFDRAWYGLHEVSREMIDHFAGNVERIKGLT